MNIPIKTIKYFKLIYKLNNNSNNKYYNWYNTCKQQWKLKVYN